jgi:hypothetical protein
MVFMVILLEMDKRKTAPLRKETMPQGVRVRRILILDSGDG